MISVVQKEFLVCSLVRIAEEGSVSPDIILDQSAGGSLAFESEFADTVGCARHATPCGYTQAAGQVSATSRRGRVLKSRIVG